MSTVPATFGGLPPPPLSTSWTDPDQTTLIEYNNSCSNEPNDHQNEVLEQLKITEQQIDSDSSDPIHDIEDINCTDDNKNAIDQENDLKLSMECMENGTLQFNRFYEDLEFIKLSPYAHGIPTGLEGLKRRLIEADGLNYEGIFRLRGMELNLNIAKEELNANKSISMIDVTPIEVAQLIKAFYRSLPCDEPGFLPNSLLHSKSDSEIIDEFDRLSEPRKSLLLWTFDLWIKIEEYKPQNKMTLQSMSIVFSPNMVRSTDPNPMVFLELQKKVQNVIHDAAKLRKQQQLIISGSNNDGNTVPFQRNRNINYSNASSEGPKYNAVRSNRHNNGMTLFKNCVLL